MPAKPITRIADLIGAVALAGWLCAVVAVPAFAGDDFRVSTAEKDAGGFLVHAVDSDFQARQTKIRVLLPDQLEQGKRCPVLYVLPVEAGDGARWGDGLVEARKGDIPNKYGLICVGPTFADVPWYADHPTNAKLRQETYLMKVVLPYVDQTYPTPAKPEGRLLVGFSKSGWGAFSLLLRHPGVFGKAAAWDAPLMLERPDKYGTGEIFATQENFAKYQISALLKQRAADLAGEARLVHCGYDIFRDDHQAAHRLMDELKIAHQYRDGPKRQHAWHSGWLPEVVQMLVEGRKNP
jgi:enterochelin esterase-like enzyme